MCYHPVLDADVLPETRIWPARDVAGRVDAGRARFQKLVDEYAAVDLQSRLLRKLQARLSKAQPVDAILRAWSEGAVGSSTFRELSEQFAQIVIPKVWEREGRKIARVATRLAISPKKVRRALSRAGLLAPAAGTETVSRGA